MKHGALFVDGEPVSVRDVLDRRVSYQILWSEEAESLGCLWLDGDRRLRCGCAEGRAVFEERVDGERSWVRDGCAHEVALLAHNERIRQSARPAPDYPATSAMWD